MSNHKHASAQAYIYVCMRSTISLIIVYKRSLIVKKKNYILDIYLLDPEMPSSPLPRSDITIFTQGDGLLFCPFPTIADLTNLHS